MPKHSNSAPAEKIGAGKTIPMPNYEYQQSSGKSGGTWAHKSGVPAKKIAALQNFVPTP